ncbi:MAG TPA: hypothetical protein DHW84_11695, partial [Firmicutes bacterium]|nr:hypothetical protein [Bacillota bacterium]
AARTTAAAPAATATVSSHSAKEVALLEAEIARLEEQLRATEALFGESAPIEVYRDYEEIRTAVEQLYQKWAQRMG